MEVADDIPDLDDMSDLVQNIKLNKQMGSQGSAPQKDSRVEEHNIKEISTHPKKVEISTNSKKVDTSKKTSQFGGMKKGFLFGGSSSGAKTTRKPASTKPISPDPDIIRPKHSNEGQKNPLVFDDVQNAMKESMAMDKSWVTDDLLKKVESNDKLTKQLSDPHIAKAITWMQKDPKAAMEYYKNDQEIQTFFKEFYGILGNHFTNLGAKQETPQSTDNLKSEDEKKMEDIIANPEIREILSKPDIQKLIELLRTNPDEAQKHLNASTPSFRSDVNKLVSAGILAFQSH